jgi:ribosomal protein S18 acetylase RimI-like enzyme
MTLEVSKLDNPVWYSLTETHQRFSINYDHIKFYHPDYCPFGGFINSNYILEKIGAYANLTDNFYIVGEKPNTNGSIILNKNLICNQMLLETPIDKEIHEYIIEIITAYQQQELFELVNKIQPGYFRKNTSVLGRYYGIYKNGQLVAAAGERMKMNAYTEVSAVVTHPEYTGKGYASELIVHTTRKIFSENKIPYLHVAETNMNAIKLYEKLGFRTRRKISFWNLKPGNQ